LPTIYCSILNSLCKTAFIYCSERSNQADLLSCHSFTKVIYRSIYLFIVRVAIEIIQYPSLCTVMHSFAQSCTALHSHAQLCTVIAQLCTVMHSPGTALHSHAQSMHSPAQLCTVMHSPCTVHAQSVAMQ